MSSTMKSLIIAVVLVVALGVAYSILAGPDRRTTSDKIGDAIQQLPNGPDKAMHELGSDRTPGEKLGDSMRKAGDKIKENSAPE